MRPEKLYSARRADRCEPQRHAHLHPPLPWIPRHLWLIATSAVPILISAVALTVSVLAYDDQHSADAASAQATREQYARLVSAWLTGPAKDGSASLFVQNLGSAPITGVGVYLQGPRMGERAGSHYSTLLGDVPPCSTAELSLPLVSVKSLSGSFGTVLFGMTQIGTLTFMDPNGVFWVRYASGRLRGGTDSQLAALARQAVSGRVQLAPARGCA